MIQDDQTPPQQSNDLQNRAEFLHGYFGKNVKGFFKTVSAVPTAAPTNYFDQIQIYQNGITGRLYIWNNDPSKLNWAYITLTFF